MEEIVAIGFINEGGKRPNPLSSKEVVTQSVKNSPKTIFADVKNDEFITIDNDVQF